MCPFHQFCYLKIFFVPLPPEVRCLFSAFSLGENLQVFMQDADHWNLLLLQQVAQPRPYQEEALLIAKCVSNNENAALALLLVPKGILLLIGALAAWPARRLCFPLCNNTRNCALCVLVAAVMCIIETPIIMRVREYPNPFYGVTGLIIMVLTAALLVIGVFPQV